MELDEIKTLAKQVIVQGHEADKSEDDIKMDMFAAKVPFSKLNALYKTISIEEGYIVDPKEVAEGVNAYITSGDIDFEALSTWDEVSSIVDGIAGEVNGATATRVLSLIRSYCKDEEIELPKKPKGSSGGGGGKGGKIAQAITALFMTNRNPTKQEFYDAVLPNVKGHRNASDITKMYLGICLGVVNQQGIETVMAELNKQSWPTDNTGSAEDADDDFEEEDVA